MLHFPVDKPVLVVGDVMLDRTINCEALRIAPEAPSPVVKVKSIELAPGGAANVALNLSELGLRVRLIGLAGKDSEADQLFDAISRRCRHSERMLVDIIPSEQRQTIVKTRFVSDNHQFLRVDREEKFSGAGPEIHHALHNHGLSIAGVAAVVLSDYDKGTLDCQTTMSIIQEAKFLGVPVFVDPKGCLSIYQDVYLFKPNEFEYVVQRRQDLSSATEPLPTTQATINEMAQRCKDYNIANIVVTLGARGMLWAQKDGTGGYVPGISMPICSVSGAGDVAMAALVASHLSNEVSPDCSVHLAVLASGLAVARPGTSVVSWFELNHAWGQRHHEAKILRREDGEAGESAYWEILERYGREARNAGKRLVFANGCFDIMHEGHSWLLSQARREGDIVFVGLNSDESVRQLKGKNRPINSLAHRQTFLSSLANVDAIASFKSEDELERLIRTVNPHVLVKGAEWRNKPIRGADWVCKHGGRVVFVTPVSPTHTSDLVKKLGKDDQILDL